MPMSAFVGYRRTVNFPRCWATGALCRDSRSSACIDYSPHIISLFFRFLVVRSVDLRCAISP